MISSRPAASRPISSSPKPAPKAPTSLSAKPTPKLANASPVGEKTFVRKTELSAQKFDKNKSADPFSTSKKHKSNFAVVYTNGGIPCRINHGGVKHSLQWERHPSELSYDPLLVTCAEGLIEKEHPYVFISRLAFKEMLECEGGAYKAVPLVTRIVPHLRNALRSPDNDTFLAAVAALEQLSNAVGQELNPHLGSLLIPMNQKIKDKSLSAVVSNALQVTANNGGPYAINTIKSKIPTFNA